MKGLIYKSTGSWYQVQAEDGKMYSARVKGVLKIDGITSTNPIAVGDRVLMEMENEGEASVMIDTILERENYIARQSPSHRMQHHIVAANVDQSFLIATLREPRTSQGFIDRFLVGSEAYHVPAHIIFNKSDLYRQKEMDKFKMLEEMYHTIGYNVVLVSASGGEGIELLQQLMIDKTTLFSGHSGVGKSSLINCLIPSLQLKTRDVSGWSGKGLHTTTFAEMFDLPGGGRLIDTPGMREFGIVDVRRAELSHYFPEMKALIHDCQFNNCAHINEPGCAVKDAVAEDRINPERYISYYNIYESIREHNY